MSHSSRNSPQRVLLQVAGGNVELVRGGRGDGCPTICAAHPADAFVEGTVELLSEAAPGSEIVCVNPRGLGGSSPAPTLSLEQMVDDVEATRLSLGIERWAFWGMSGGGWLAQLYAKRFPSSVAGIIVESACLCFRDRLRDPACVLSPFFPAWQSALTERGLLQLDSHAAPSPGADTDWFDLPNVGQVFRRRGGPALLVSPAPAAPAMQRIMPRLWEFDSRPWIREVRTPTLVLCGIADPIVPVSHAKTVHEAVAGSTFAAIEGASHVPTAQRHPDALRAVQDFIHSL
jgi:proline iminopeptidase